MKQDHGKNRDSAQAVYIGAVARGGKLRPAEPVVTCTQKKEGSFLVYPVPKQITISRTCDPDQWDLSDSEGSCLSRSVRPG